MRDGISTTTSVDPVDTEREIEESVQEPLIIKEKLPWQENVESEADTSLQHILNKFSEGYSIAHMRLNKTYYFTVFD